PAGAARWSAQPDGGPSTRAPPVTSTRLDTASPCQSQRGHSSALKAKPGYHLDKKRQILSFPKNLAQPSGDAGEREIARRNRVVALQDLVARHLFRNARRVREERPLLGTGLAVRIAVTRDRRHDAACPHRHVVAQDAPT